MYPRNNASPERIAIGPVVQISDGAVQTSGVSVKVLPQGATASAGAGTIAYEEGVVHYLPTQAETDYTSFVLIAFKSGCIPATTTIVTSASATAGTVLLAPVTHTSAVIPTVTTTTTATNLTNLPTIPSNWLTAAGIAAGALNGKGDWNIGKTGYALTATTGLGNQTATITGNLTGSVGSVTGAVGSVTGLTVAHLDVAVSSRMASYTQPTGFLAASFPATVASPTNITAATGVTLAAVTHTGAVIPTVSTLTGHTAQTGDAFARLGAPAAASVSADVAAVKAKTDLIPAAPAAVGDIPSASTTAAAVGALVVEGTTTVIQSLRLSNSALGGKASGLDTTSPVYRDLADTKDRITATVDADGNRSAVTRDLT